MYQDKYPVLRRFEKKDSVIIFLNLYFCSCLIASGILFQMFASIIGKEFLW